MRSNHIFVFFIYIYKSICSRGPRIRFLPTIPQVPFCLPIYFCSTLFTSRARWGKKTGNLLKVALARIIAFFWDDELAFFHSLWYCQNWGAWKLARATFWTSFMYGLVRLIRSKGMDWIWIPCLFVEIEQKGSPPTDPYVTEQGQPLPRELKHPQTLERRRRREAWFMDLECWETWSGWNSTLASFMTLNYKPALYILSCYYFASMHHRNNPKTFFLDLGQNVLSLTHFEETI